MQTSVLILGILLAGQISETGGGRYGELPATPPARGGIAEAAPPPAEQPPRRGDAAVVPPGKSNQLRVEQPAKTAASNLTKVTTAADLLSNLSKPVGPENLAGVPLSLADTVRNTPSRAEQTRRVRLYWELSEAVTNFHLDSLTELEIQSLRRGLVQASPAWTEAQQTAAARKRVSRSAVELAQVRLQNALGQPGQTELPLPADLPHCGAYETKYEQIFRGRGFSEAEQLSELLPLRHAELGRHAVAAITARDWLIKVSKQRSPQDDGMQLLKAYENLVLQRRAFVTSTYDYNTNIARYTELAVPQEIGTVRLVSMLIQSEVADARNLADKSIPQNDESVRQTSAEQALPPNRDSAPQQRTFVGGRRNQVRRPSADDRTEAQQDKPQEERSILVTPNR